jgi:hypothetical protein
MKTIRTLFQFVVAALVLLPAYAGAQTDTIPGYTLQFNGSSHVDLGNSTDFNFSGSFTLEAWIKVDQFTHDWQAILTKGDSEWRLHRNSSSNFIAFGTTNLVDGSNNPDLVGTTNVNDGLWHHLAAVYDASALTKYFYVDGNLDASTSVTGTLGADSYSAYIGENAEQTGRQWQGNIDEVRIWNIARTAAQIRSTVHRTLTGSETGLLDYYQFNNGSGTTLTDAKAVHNGTLVNSPSWVSSTVAIGRGNEVSTTGFTSGTVSLGNISMTTTDAFDNPVDI